jgi:hypothetical protein
MTPDDHLITRAADVFILDAQSTLNTYRSDKKLPKAIPYKDRRLISLGIFYALAKGQHLDFSKTEFEMQKDDKNGFSSG